MNPLFGQEDWFPLGGLVLGSFSVGGTSMVQEGVSGKFLFRPSGLQCVNTPHQSWHED